MLNDPLGETFREPRTGMLEPYDGHEDIWWEDRDQLVQMLRSDKGKSAMNAVIEDEKQFIDSSRSSIWLSKEVPQINPMPENSILALNQNNIFKIVFVLNGLPEMGMDACQEYWQMKHGYMARRYGKAMGFLRYIQSHALVDPLNEELQVARGTSDVYAGLTEVWADRVELAQIMTTP